MTKLQLIKKNWFQFDVKLPSIKPAALLDLTELELNQELEKG